MLTIEKLSSTHNIEDFDCGSSDLNRFLQRYALQNQQSNSAPRNVGYKTIKDDREFILINIFELTIQIETLQFKSY